MDLYPCFEHPATLLYLKKPIPLAATRSNYDRHGENFSPPLGEGAYFSFAMGPNLGQILGV
ncbi:MAG: hypothetical protein DRG76_09385 [Deltaproteobacteria bacterium]|nr:MAG: hypothetical protein DRG76_09385 [Deltaproteobacteria bacterium]